MENCDKKRTMTINVGWLQGIREGKKILYRDKLYKATDVGSCITVFDEIAKPHIYDKILIYFKHWVYAVWKSFLRVLKKEKTR